MKVEQFVMAYRADHEKIKALLPQGFESLRPVLRINAEILTDSRQADKGATYYYIEFNTPVAHDGKRGWLNLGNWDSMSTDIKVTRKSRDGEGRLCVTFDFGLLTLTHTGTGKEGGCPAESDNDGCFYLDGDDEEFRPAEKVEECKEYTDCEFEWKLRGQFPKVPLFEAINIKCEEILGAYMVEFERLEENLMIFR